MSSEHHLVPAGALPPAVVEAEAEALDQLALAFERESIAPSTKRAYAARWAMFAAWCAARGYESLPAAGVTLTRYATAAVSEGIDGGKPMGLRSLEVHLAAVRFVHRMTGHDVPDLPTQVQRGIRRTIGRPPKKKRWLSQKQLNEAVRELPNNLKGLRDRALLLVAFAAGGRRREEIAGLLLEDLTPSPLGGFEWYLRRSKTDQEGHGLQLLIPRHRVLEVCPARALEQWLSAAGITGGPVFRSVSRHGRVGTTAIQPGAVAQIVKDAVIRIGLDPTVYAGHSLRSGFATDMARKGVRLEDVMARTGHRSVVVAQGYVRAGQLLAQDSPVARALNEDE